MGLFDEMTKAVGRQISEGSGQGGLMEQILGLIDNPETGGIGGLIEGWDRPAHRRPDRRHPGAAGPGRPPRDGQR